MENNNFPTKRNLINARHGLKLAKQGHNLLDKKRQVLQMELNTAKLKSKHLKEKLTKTISYAKIAIDDAESFTGRKVISKTVSEIPISNHVKIYYLNIMGINLPQVNTDKNFDANYPQYVLGKTNIYIDNAHEKWLEVEKITLIYAETQNVVTYLEKELRRTRKRTAALENIIIPRYEIRIKYISEQLEEKERDEIVRIKSINSHAVFTKA